MKETLSVTPGIDHPPSIDPAQAARFRRRKKPALTVAQYVDGILRGDRAILGQAITLVESLRPRDEAMAQEIIEQCLEHAGDTLRVGITGIPGAGKSTFIEALGTYLTRERGQKVAVLAVDPSSEFSGGSILGDKTRMETLASDERAFIRPSPSRGSLGGVARRTRETMILCEAAGYRIVLVETVGVGQSETAVYSMVDFFLLLMIAGAGDELQGVKRGIVEMTDLIAMNKADGANRVRAEAARREYESALRLLPPSASGWAPRVVTCSAIAREGIAEIWQVVEDHHAQMRGSGWFQARRRDQLGAWLQAMIDQGLRERFAAHREVRSHYQEFATAVANGRMTSFRAAQRLLEIYHRKDS
jgi:LAO/AO transport system kinase